MDGQPGGLNAGPEPVDLIQADTVEQILTVAPGLARTMVLTFLRPGMLAN